MLVQKAQERNLEDSATGTGNAASACSASRKAAQWYEQSATEKIAGLGSTKAYKRHVQSNLKLGVTHKLLALWGEFVEHAGTKVCYAVKMRNL